jgi:N utilization substance protein A
MKSDFYAAISQIAAERGIPREAIIDVMEKALITAYKKTLGNNPPPIEIEIKMDPQSGLAKVLVEKVVVDEVYDDRFEIELSEAQRKQPDVYVGETIIVDSTPRDFGRIAAQTAKQIVLQGIKEVEREYIYGEFMGKEGELVAATVQRITKGNVILELGKAEAILPPKEQVDTDRYYHGQRIKVYLTEIRKDERGTRLIASRSHKNLILRLFEMEVPEIYNETVELKSVAREPGLRTKVAVSARQEGIDPVGSCVGMRGIRIQNIVNELNGEKIDVVQWSPDPKEYIANALSPAQVVEVHLHEGDRAAVVIVPDKQLSLAIGREGQNVRLAAKLTGWRIDIKSATTLLEEERESSNAREFADAEAMATEAALSHARAESRKVRLDGTVVYQNIYYGPLGDELAGETVQIRSTPHKLYIYYHDRLVASYILNDDVDETTGEGEEGQPIPVVSPLLATDEDNEYTEDEEVDQACDSDQDSEDSDSDQDSEDSDSDQDSEDSDSDQDSEDNDSDQEQHTSQGDEILDPDTDMVR